MLRWKRIKESTTSFPGDGGKRQQAGPDPSMMGSSYTEDPWPNEAHQPMPNPGRLDPRVEELIAAAAKVRPTFPGMNSGIGQYVSSQDPHNYESFPGDVIREQGPGGVSAPAPNETAIADNPKPTTWVHMGDNGIEVTPSPANDETLGKMIRQFQQVRFTPMAPHNINKIGQLVDGREQNDDTEPQEIPDLIKHLSKDHGMLPFIDRMIVLPAPQQKELHMGLHQQGQNTHNPEVLRVAGTWINKYKNRESDIAKCLDYNQIPKEVINNPDTTDDELLDIHDDFLKQDDYSCVCGNKTANILDPIQPGLDPDVFDNAESEYPLLKPVIARWIKNTVHKIFKENGYEDSDRWLKLVLTGSLTTLQWSADSDFDISLWVDLEEFEAFDRAEIVKMIVDKLDGTIVPGTTHPLQCFVVNVFEVHGASDIYQPGLRSAWDIDEHRWIVPPETDRVHDVGKEYPDLYHRGLQVAEKMRSLLDYQPERAKTYWHYIHSQRRKAMKAGRGDYSPENITYKMLANSNLFPRIEETTGEHIARNLQYIETTFEDGDIVYHNLKAILPNQSVKTASIENITDYELNKIHTAAGEVAQFSWVEIPGLKTESEGVEVHPDFRRKGIASRLISIAKEISPDLKASRYRTEDGERFIKSTHLLESPKEVERVHLESRYAQSPSPQYTCNVCQGPTSNINPMVCDACRNLEGGNVTIDSSSRGTSLQERVDFAAGDEIHEFK